MLTLPYRPIIVSAECLSNQAPGSLLEADWGGKRHADSQSLLLRIKIQNRQDEKDRCGHDDRDAARFETGDRRKYHYDGYGKEGAAAATHCRIDSRRRSKLRSLTLGRAEHLHFLYGFAIPLRSLSRAQPPTMVADA